MAGTGEPTTPVRVQRPPHRSNAIVLIVGPPIAPTEVRALCEHVRAVVEDSDAELVVCDVGALVDPDLVAVDLLARLVLTVRQLGRALRVRRAQEKLQDLWCVTGLDLVLPLGGGLRLGPWRQTEQWEEPLSVEEERHPRDPLT